MKSKTLDKMQKMFKKVKVIVNEELQDFMSAEKVRQYDILEQKHMFSKREVQKLNEKLKKRKVDINLNLKFLVKYVYFIRNS